MSNKIIDFNDAKSKLKDNKNKNVRLEDYRNDLVIDHLSRMSKEELIQQFISCDNTLDLAIILCISVCVEKGMNAILGMNLSNISYTDVITKTDLFYDKVNMLKDILTKLVKGEV